MNILYKSVIWGVLALLVMPLSETVYAKSVLQSMFEAVYSHSQSTQTADCQTCHARQVNQLNSYGKALCDQLTDEANNTERLLSFQSRAIVAEGLDSDGDGFSNIEEINGSAQPGWTLGELNPTYAKVFNKNVCVATGLFEAAPTWVPTSSLDPQPVSNRAPVSSNDTSSTAIDTSVTIDVLGNDIDANGDQLEVSTVTGGASVHGSISNDTSDVTYTPDSGFCGTAIFQYRATDGVETSNVATVTVSVGDTEAPQVSTPAANLTISLPAGNSQVPASDSEIANWLATASASDSVDGSLPVTVNAPTIFEAGTTAVVFSAIDSCGNTSTATANVIIIIESNNPPVVVSPEPNPLVVTASLCANSISSTEENIANWLGLATASDIEDGALGTISNAPSSFLIGNTTVGFSATDSLGAVGWVNATVSVLANPNSAPVLNLASPLSMTVSATTTSVSSTDTTIQDFLSYASAFDDEDGNLAVTHDAPVEFNLGTTTVTFTATDDCGLLSSSQSTVTIIADLINNPPSITAPAPVDFETALCASSLAVTDPLISGFFDGVSAADDEDGDLSSSVINDALASLPVAQSPGVFTTITFSVTDSGNPTGTPISSTTTSRIRLTDPNTQPTLVAPAPIATQIANQSIPATDSVITTFLASATAQDLHDGALSYSNNAPATFEPGTTTVTFTTTDSCGLVTTDSSTVTIPIDLTAPVITLLGDSLFGVEQFTAFVDPGATANDNVDGDLTGSVVASGAVNTAVLGSYTRTYQVSDAAGNSTTETRTVNVTVPPDTVAPVIALLGDNPFDVLQNTTFVDPGATASDNVDGDVTASIIASGVVDTSVLGTYIRNYMVSDSAGNTILVTRTVNVIADTTAPVITLLGSNPITLEQGSAFTDPGASASDDIDGDLTANIVTSGTVDTGVVGSYTRLYQVSDAAGNTATVTRTVSITTPADIIAPVITLLGSNPITIEQHAAFTDPGATANDNIDGDITTSIVASGFVDIAVVGSYTRRYQVSDVAGNVTTLTRTVVVTPPADTAAPVITLLGDNPITIEQGTAFTDPGATANDDIDGDLTANIVASGNVDTTITGTYVRRYQVSDAAGNITIATRTVSVILPADVAAPVITLLGGNPILIEQGAAFIDPGATASDDVDGDLTANIVASGLVDTGVVGTYTRNYRVADTAGNSISMTRSVIVTLPADTTAPVITLIGSNPITIEQNSAFTDPGATANDNVDGDLTGNIVASGTVNTAAVGNYILTYQVIDASGNSATVTRTVSVTSPADTIAPVITLLGSNPFILEQNTTFTDPGATANDNVDGNITSNIVASGTVNTAVVGSYIRSYSVSDAAGNTVTATRVVNVTAPIDIIAPVITVLGSNPMNVEQHALFIDLGANASDNVDGNISANVIASGTVNVGTVGTYSIRYNVSDASGNAAVTATRIVNVQPATAPVISLSGDNPLQIPLGGAFSEPGYSATDNVDGNITANVVIDSATVNTSAIGSYFVTYDVSDAVGNAATTVTRTVIVAAAIDQTQPVITLLGDNPLELGLGNAFVEPGFSASDNADGDITLSVLVDSSAVNTNVVGSYSVTYNVADAAGNIATTVMRTVNVVSALSTYSESPALSVGAASVSTTITIADDLTIADLNVFIDMPHDYPGDVSIFLTSPAGTSVKIVDDPGKPASTWGCSNDDFLVTLDDEGTGNVEDACTSPPAISGTLIPNNALSAFDGESTQGTWTLRLDDSYTSADTGTLNNWRLIITAEPTVSNDVTAPIITLLGDNPLDITLGGTFSDPGFSATDNIDGNLSGSVSINSSSVNTNAVGSYSVTYNVSDASGNNATTVTRIVNVSAMGDQTPPVITLSGDSPLEIPIASVYVEPGYSATDNVDGNITGSVSVDVSALNTNTAGSYLVIYSVIDAAGNAASMTRWVNVTTGPDTTAPVITLSGDNPLEVVIGGSYSEPGYSAVDNTDGNITVNVIVDASGVNTSAIGSYLVTYNVADAEGNTATTIIRTVNVSAADITAPVIILSGDNPLEITEGGTFSEPGYAATDNIDGNITGSVSVNTSSVNTSVIGSYLVTYDVIDSAGNAATTATRIVNVTAIPDTTAPVIMLSGDNPLELVVGSSYSEPGHSATDNVDGDITSSVSINSSAVNTGAIGSYSVTYNVSDAAGNAATTTTRVVNVVSASSTYTENPALSVGAASVSTTLTITDDRQIADLNVFIDMPHDYPGDVSITLISPAGTSVTIVDGPGKPASSWGCSNDDFLVTLDDEGTGNVEDACASPPAINGTLIPNNALSAFDGESTQGTWTLRLDDSYTSADTGTLDNWHLVVTAEPTEIPVPVVDTTAPVLTLLGSASIDLQNGDTFNDPGATASDNTDGNISASITVSGSVDVNTDGPYILTYNVQDAAGNSAVSISRTVNVLSAPTIFAEAETGTIGGNHNVISNHAGYTGSGFVDYAGEGYMEYTFVGSAVPYDLTVRYALGSGNRPLEVVLNGATLGTINFPATGAWTSWLSTAPFTVTPLSGTNTLRLQTAGSSGANVDSFTLTPQ